MIYPTKYNQSELDKKEVQAEQANQVADQAVTQGLNTMAPGIGSLVAASSQAGDSIKGDGSSTFRNIIGENFDPIGNITDAVKSGNLKEAIPVLGGKFEADRLKKEAEKEERKQQIRQSKAIDKDSAGFYRRFRA